VTDAIFAKTKTITRIRTCHAFPDVDLGKVGATVVRKGAASGSFPQVAEEVTVEVIDSVEDYGRLLARVFDFDALRTFLARPDFRMIYDALSGGACDEPWCAVGGCSAWPCPSIPCPLPTTFLVGPPTLHAAWTAVAGVYAQKILSGTLGVPSTGLANCEPKPDFGGHHPDPNLTYASELVKAMGEALPLRQ